MKCYRVNKETKDYVANVLARRGYKYELLEEGGEVFCRLEISSKKFHAVVVRARMEKMTVDVGSPIPYIAVAELDDDDARDDVGSAYVIKERSSK